MGQQSEATLTLQQNTASVSNNQGPQNDVYGDPLHNQNQTYWYW